MCLNVCVGICEYVCLCLNVCVGICKYGCLCLNVCSYVSVDVLTLWYCVSVHHLNTSIFARYRVRF